MAEYTLNYTSSEEAKIVRERWQDLLPSKCSLIPYT